MWILTKPLWELTRYTRSITCAWRRSRLLLISKCNCGWTSGVKGAAVIWHTTVVPFKLVEQFNDRRGSSGSVTSRHLTRMKHLLRTKRKKSLESPLQHISGRPPNTVAGPPDQRAELGPGIPTQHTWHRMDLDRELLAPGAWNSGIAISTGPSHGDQRTSKRS